MNTTFEFNKTLQRLSEICFSAQWSDLDPEQNQLKTRLQTVTSASFNPEVDNAWRTRMIVRARLRRYASN